ncbi:IS701 family transposase [Streptomyces sp. E-15]
MGRIAGRFARYEPRLRAGRLVLGLLSDLPRKNCWTIAEWVGEASPHGMQHLLCRAAWDAEAVRDDVREYVVEHLHDEAAVLVVDETGDVKKGIHTVGVQRQYTGTAGRIENAQVAVYLVYAGARGHAAVDRELYIPRSWTGDPDRCRAAGLGEDTVFATKPDLALRMIERFWDAGHCVGWVTADEVYGGNPRLRAVLEERGVGYALAVACSAEMATGAGRFRADVLVRLAHAFLAVVRADEHARSPAPDGLVPLSCNEIQRLFITVTVQPRHDTAYRLGWSHWRRLHQQRSLTSHYRRQAASQT